MTDRRAGRRSRRHVKRIDGSPHGKQRQEEAERPQHQLPRAKNKAETTQMQIPCHHHNHGDRGLNDRANFHADVEAIVKRANQHQYPRAGQIQRGVRNIIIGDGESKTDACIN